jgi:prephenate dehydrogenase
VLVGSAEHDRWVALVSHAPHLVAAAMAARLSDAPAGALGLAGQGLRDVTRVAAGDAALWTQILSANAAPVADVLAAVAADLSVAADLLSAAATAPSTTPGGPAGPPVPAAPEAVKPVAALLESGQGGVARIPGKRGGPAQHYASLQVVIADQPGELARLFQAAGDAEVNIEDVGIEHSPGLPVGVAELFIRPDEAERLAAVLRGHGWPVHGVAVEQ